MTRKPISKKLRFEVFKRDRFSCQYCGTKAPDTVLHVDHIHPVKAGGKNDILNLVTACVACNAGKGARKLDDRSEVERQRAQIEELQDRREQLEMMLQWRDQAERERTDVVQEVVQRVAGRGGFEPNESGRAHIRRWLKRFELPDLLAALDESFDHYMRWNADDPDQDAWETAFKKIPAIASLRLQAVKRPYVPKLAYIQGILRKRFRDPRGNYINALEEYHLADGIELLLLEEIAKRSDTWDDFCGCAELALERRAEATDGED